MHIHEMKSCLMTVKGFYAFGVNDHIVEFWHKKVGQYYSAEEFKNAFELYLEHGQRAPLIPDMKKLLRNLYGTQSPKAAVKVSIPVRKIDICMDVLTPAYVTHELKSIVGAPTGSGDWARLVKSRNWVPAYNKKLEEMYSLACERVREDRGYVPREWPEPILAKRVERKVVSPAPTPDIF